MKDGLEILKVFHKKLLEMSADDKKKVEKLLNDKGGTFKGAAWSFYQNKRYSPHAKSSATKAAATKAAATNAATTKSSATTAAETKAYIKDTTKASTTKELIEKKERKPYIKELRPGIRTIMFK